MPYGYRTFLCGLALALVSSLPFAAAPNATPLLPGAGPTPPFTGTDSLRVGRPHPADTAAARFLAEHPDSAGTVRAVKGDSGSLGARPDSARKDSLAKAASDTSRPVFAWLSPLRTEACRVGAEGALACWRTQADIANQEIGFAGPRAWSLSLTNWRPLPQSSPYFPFWKDSPYLSGGLAPPDRFALHRTGGDLDGIEEAWTPVAPLDTPVTRLDWTRGALTLNVFDLRLQRMLSDRVYLGMEYYSATADTVTYDYQFNVHQPYLGGWGFLGKLYAPIDRDSASLVLAGTSHSIHALGVRPRVGFWLDTNRVLEVFLDQTRNATSLTFPRGKDQVNPSAIPTGPDSMQALMPARFSAFGQGAIYGETHAAWTGQFELAHDQADLSEFVPSGTGKAGSTQKLSGDMVRARAAMRATGYFAQPALRLETRSEYWSGNPLGTDKAGKQGWGDAEDAELEASPELGMLSGRAQAGMGRASRMADQVYWLPRFGALARLDLPLGFAAEASLSSRAEDPSWETLYRGNPARFRFASPDVKPRTDRTARASASWAWSRFSLEAGFDRMDGQDAWLPRVLPNPGACAALADSEYIPLQGRHCADSSLTDTLALGLRNYSSEIIDAWHLGVGLGLGNWTLGLRNRFVLSRTVDDPDLKATLEDLSVPERVFQGRLRWKRNLLDDRLKLDFAWDWEWFSTRYAWSPDLAGSSRVVKLDEYLDLDFEANMLIKTFTLYFKVRNFNHDRYATEPGVHPPGLNFRFGVDWMLTN